VALTLADIGKIVLSTQTLAECKAFGRWNITLRTTGFMDFVHRLRFFIALLRNKNKRFLVFRIPEEEQSPETQ
jgi:hypothetical protein